MTEIASAPVVQDFEIAMDAWTEPFWAAADRGVFVLPRCSDCRRYRWPPGPFCPNCRAQAVDWTVPGPARIYSFTIVRRATEGQPTPTVTVPALIEFPEADDIRVVAAIIDTPVDAIAIGAAVELGWSQASNGRIPVFKVVQDRRA